MVAGSGIAGFTMLRMFNTVENGPAAPVKKEWKVVNVDRGSRNIDGYSMLINHQKLDERRLVRVRAYMSVAEMERAAGMQAGVGEYAGALIAPKLAQQECTVLVETMARSCAVQSASFETTRRPGIHLLVMKLMFVQRDDFGSPPTGQELSYLENSVALTRSGGRSDRTDRGGQASLRRGYYVSATSACQRFRSMHGNCAIKEIDVSASLDETGHMTNVSGRATLSLLQKQPTAAEARSAAQR